MRVPTKRCFVDLLSEDFEVERMFCFDYLRNQYVLFL